MEHSKKNTNSQIFNAIEDPVLSNVIKELGRTINLVTTYGPNHPAAESAVEGVYDALKSLFADHNKITIGAYNGILTVDDVPVRSVGALQKSLERRLARLHITGLRINRGISVQDLVQLSELLSANEPDAFHTGLARSEIANVETEHSRLQAVREGQTVVDEQDLAGMVSSSDLAGMGNDGVLVLEDESEKTEPKADESNLHVDQIVAFLKGDVDVSEGNVGEELTELASDPARLAKMIVESVAIRQSVPTLAGESLNDIILGCLRRTYNGLRKQSTFNSPEGKVELLKALMLLEESVLDSMRDLLGDENPELDRVIVQAIHEMKENINFEITAAQYIETRDAIERNKQQMQQFIQARGAGIAESLLEGSGFPGADWRKIVIDSGQGGKGEAGSALTAGLSKLATVFEKLEHLMKSKTADGSMVKDLLGQANHNLDDTLENTKEKLAVLSQQIIENGAATIGGQARGMSREELLAALSEVTQELMQPLTAINASLEMMLNGFVGDFTGEQNDLLTLASNSGEHLKFLMNMLIDIVGCPTNKGVDPRFHTTSEEVVLMKDAQKTDSSSE